MMKITKRRDMNRTNTEDSSSNNCNEIVWRIDDKEVLSAGEYYGIGKQMYTIKSSKTGELYVKIIVGVRLNSGNESRIAEVESVYPAKYYKGSKIYRICENLGLVKERKIYPSSFTNIQVKLLLEPNSPIYREYNPVRIAEIYKADKMPDDRKFTYKMSASVYDYGELEPVIEEYTTEEHKHSEIVDDEDDDFSDY